MGNEVTLMADGHRLHHLVEVPQDVAAYEIAFDHIAGQFRQQGAVGLQDLTGVGIDHKAEDEEGIGGVGGGVGGDHRPLLIPGPRRPARKEGRRQSRGPGPRGGGRGRAQGEGMQ